MTGRAYPIFDIARLILNSGDRFKVRLRLKEGEHPVELVHFAADDSLWLSKEEALRHLHYGKVFEQFYKREKIDVEPPKGNFSVLAVCGYTGIVFGPPNFHGYSKNVNDLYMRRFTGMPLEVYKRRIEMVRDEERLQKWKESLSSEIQYTYLKGDSETPVTFKTLAEVERHFLATHGDSIQSIHEATITGAVEGKPMSGALQNMIIRAIDRQRRLPILMVKTLSPKLEQAGLKFFKIDKKETYVARSRPRGLDLGPDMSPRIGQIVSFVQNNPGKDLNILVSALVETRAPEGAAEPSAEEVAMLKDLRWLIREGYVTEFSDGGLQVLAGPRGLQPVHRQARPEKKKQDGAEKQRKRKPRRIRWRRRRLGLRLPRPPKKSQDTPSTHVWLRRLAKLPAADQARSLRRVSDPALRMRIRKRLS